TVSETAVTGTNLSDYSVTFGGACDSSGNVTLAAGDNRSEESSETREPRLTVTKTLVPSADTGKFNLQIDSSTAGTGANVGDGGTTGAVVTTIGSHTVSETAVTGTNLSDYSVTFGGACDSSGNVTLAAGDN